MTKAKMVSQADVDNIVRRIIARERRRFEHEYDRGLREQREHYEQELARLNEALRCKRSVIGRWFDWATGLIL
jgi:hypothetical protein